MAEQVAIKPDPEAENASPMNVDEDVYEDHGEVDLEFYSPYDVNGNPTPEDYLWMARIPTYVWQAWDKLDDDTPVQIGALRVWSELDKKANCSVRKTRLLLKTNVGEHQGLPREYELMPMDPKVPEVNNTFVFTEADLEEFKSKNKLRKDATDQGIPSYLLRDRNRVEKPAQEGGRGGRRGRKEYFRHVVPKKTAIAGRVRQEMTMNPIENPETAYIMSVRAQDQVKPKKTLQIIDRYALSNSLVQAGTNQARHQFSGFIKNAPRPTKKQRAEAKTARLPRNVLLDALCALFKEYKYWPLKSIKARIQQPEVYLRQCLEEVAVLHKSGTFANNWSLKPELQTDDTMAAHDGGAPEIQADADDEDEDEEEEEMEDVLP